jgi:hypothetical protein
MVLHLICLEDFMAIGSPCSALRFWRPWMEMVCQVNGRRTRAFSINKFG